MKRFTNSLRAGFTLVEMMVIAPIVILLIGGFIALVVNLTGEVMSSRGATMLAYNLQSTLNRIEEDVKLSTTFLSVNNIAVNATTQQGYNPTSSTNFTNVDKRTSGGTPASLILNAIATDGNPLSSTTGPVYLKDQPNPCSSTETYKNRPMTVNIVYFVDTSNTLWRRVLMPQNYASIPICGTAPWQVPTCQGTTFCKAKDEKMLEGVTPANFTFQYYATAGSASPNPTAVDPAATDDARNTSLLSSPTVEVNITARQTIAGRDLSRSASLRATRLDVNATSIAKDTPVTSVPDAPIPTGNVSNGHVVTFTWPRVDGATSYAIDYQIKSAGAACDATGSGTWTTGSTNISSTVRSYSVSAGTHTDRVCARVKAKNSLGTSTSFGTTNVVIPLWAPLLLQGAWTDYTQSTGVGYSTAAYTKTKAGLVMLKGLIKSSTVPAAGSVIAQLPSDYAPGGGTLIFSTSINANVQGRIDVRTSGDITANVVANGWTSLETIRFLPASASYTRTTPTLQNSWVNYDAGYAPASYAKDSSGRVTVQGLVKSGVLTSNLPIFTLPNNTSYAPPQYMNVLTRSTGVDAHVGVRNDVPSITARGTGSNSYMSLNLTYLPVLTTPATTWSNLTLQGGWINFGDVYTTPQYTVDGAGVVQLKGHVKSGTITSGTVVAKIPTGAFACPAARVLYATTNNGVFSRVDITLTGDVVFYGTSNAWFSLDNISFLAEKAC